jgi:ankyrin repeat protein
MLRRQHALHDASEGGHAELVTLLVESGADARALKADGRTALRNGAMSGRVAVVEALLALGADPLTRTAEGLTAVDMADSPVMASVLGSAGPP